MVRAETLSARNGLLPERLETFLMIKNELIPTITFLISWQVYCMAAPLYLLNGQTEDAPVTLFDRQ